ncbi:TRAP transporter small permease [Alkalihalobacillus deserti]|uniref:TRAP transporter small permease n=1 Tax=Alkalihalobacillus deserti TaxID=2879466 RepID=UPI001D1510A7|nr:TRAP transporter small permease [Alkalihalobacillus deserti]
MKSTLIEKNIIERILNTLVKMVEYLVMLSVGLMSIIVIINVFFRYVLQMPIVGTEELALILLVWVTFLGASLGVRKREMVAVTFLIDKFPPFFYKVTQIFIQVSILLFSLLLLYFGYEWLTSSNVINSKSSALKIPLWIPYSVFPLSMFMITVFTLDNIRFLLKKR